jgi:arginyl-tRNA synthetase
MMIQEQLTIYFNNVLKKRGLENIEDSLSIGPPSREEFGDYACNAALIAAKHLNQNTIETANQLKEDLLSEKGVINLVEKIDIVAPGFMNLTVKNEALWNEATSNIKGLRRHPGPPLKGKKIMVEFSSPNIAKPFNVGHLRSTIIGDSLARMYSYLGATVLRDNHLGDWGTQYGKLAYAVERWGDWKKIEKDPIRELFQLYVHFHQLEENDPSLTEQGRQYFKRLEEGEPKVRDLWKKLVDISMRDFNQLYDLLDIHFDHQLGESFYEKYLAEVIKECKDKGVAKESEGALLIFFPDEDLKEAPLMIQKSNQTSTYATRDLAGIKYRLEQFGLDQLIIEIGNEQALYFKQVIRAAEMIGWAKPGQVVHVGHGLFLWQGGRKMSTRRGETVWLKELIDEMHHHALSIVKEKSPDLSEKDQEEIAQVVAIGALKYNDLSQNRQSNVVFDKNKSLSLEGNSAPYLQYTYARGMSLLKEAGRVGITDMEALRSEWRDKIVLEDISATERSVVLWLTRFDKAVEDAATAFIPSTLATYLFNLAQKFNLFYHSEPVLGAPEQQRVRRLILALATTQALKTGLGLLGIKAPERM